MQPRGGLDDRPDRAPATSAVQARSTLRGDLFGRRRPTGDHVGDGLAGDAFAQAHVHQRTPVFRVSDDRPASM